ncbi:MAG TPA: PEP-CTERM sorting domain-containing protein, partial [Nitrospiraceae bacterium]|nr:PEP-CTERM sorting domain-containing protein [Nitrospiraceae bacterium]
VGLSSVRVDQELVLFSEGGTSTLGGVQTTFAQGGVTPPPGLIPEPSTLVLLGSGFLGIGLWAGRRLRASKSTDR